MHSGSGSSTRALLRDVWGALGGAPDLLAGVEFVGTGDIPSVFAVGDLAAASIAAAAAAIAELIAARHGARPAVRVDRRLAALWFGVSLRPEGWALPPQWDALAGDYPAADGWIRIHTNAPHHRAAALAVLDAPADKDAVARAVARWPADALEAAIVEHGGCAATLRSAAAWAEHPQGRAVAAEPLVHTMMTEPAVPPGWPIPPERPLQGVRVLDLTRVLAGPVTTRFLAGFGAEVLRIDPPGWDEPANVPDVTLGKRCARLDLRQEKDRTCLERLLGDADVLVHGYRPDALAGLGLDAERRRALRPGLVDVALDAYGWSGPWRGRRGYDSLVQMSSGIAAAGMRLMGRDRPTPLPVQALDHATGYLLAAAAARGLARRLITGRGVEARASLARTAALLLTLPADANASPLGPRDAADESAAVENTGWGPARRLKAPSHVDGAPMAWARPAGPLGTASPTW